MKFLPVIFFASVLSFASKSHACTYMVDELGKKNELASYFLTTMNIGIDEVFSKVTKLEIKDFSFFESKSTPMCPEEMTYSAQIEMAYFDNGYCFANTVVTLVEGWGEDSYRYFKVDNPAGGPNCLFP